jgi:hypothetical protein
MSLCPEVQGCLGQWAAGMSTEGSLHKSPAQEGKAQWVPHKAGGCSTVTKEV